MIEKKATQKEMKSMRANWTFNVLHWKLHWKHMYACVCEFMAFSARKARALLAFSVEQWATAITK